MKYKKQNFIFRLKNSFNHIKRFRGYIYFAFALFLISCFIAIVFPTPISLVSIINNVLKEIVEKTRDLSGIKLIGFIFINNLFASVMGLLFGILFCIVPFFILVSNGYLLGYIIKRIIEKIGLSDGIISLWRLLPHGIFEIPAVMISLGFGFKLGVNFFQALTKGSFKNFKKEIFYSLNVLIFVILPLLFIAAIIEGLLITLFG